MQFSSHFLSHLSRSFSEILLTCRRSQTFFFCAIFAATPASFPACVKVLTTAAFLCARNRRNELQSRKYLFIMSWLRGMLRILFYYASHPAKSRTPQCCIIVFLCLEKWREKIDNANWNVMHTNTLKNPFTAADYCQLMTKLWAFWTQFWVAPHVPNGVSISRR